jgi:hypothetical protein
MAEPGLVFEMTLPTGHDPNLVIGTLKATENGVPVLTLSATSGHARHQYREPNGTPHVWEVDESPLPPGHYAIETVKQDTSAQLREKMGPFYFRILPDDVASPGGESRSLLRIHFDGPAGGPPDGTEGCIGFRSLDDRLPDWMQKWHQQGYWVVPLEVVYT